LHAYGSYRLSSQLTWNGIFYGGSSGSDVTAIHYGRVIFSDYLKGYGLLLIVDHGDGYMSLYAHNQTLYKEIGDWVSSKEVIAAVGNSGGLEHSGLYFEIRHQGQPQDPKQWLGPHS
jgi:septal ring factor EnvC (AmiA/AmiB activator)